MVIRQELEFLALQEERKDGYRRVATPHITKEALYYRSRHLPYYGEGMYSPLDIDGENYYLQADELPAPSPDLSARRGIPIASCRCASPSMARTIAMRRQAACRA